MSLPGERLMPILNRDSDMKRQIGLLIITAGVILFWFIAMTEDGQAMGREIIIWLRAVGGT